MCGAYLSSMHEPDEGTAFWCIGKLKDDTRCGYSRFEPISPRNKKIGITQYEYARYRGNLK
jgi:hypothetical protein